MLQFWNKRFHNAQCEYKCHYLNQENQSYDIYILLSDQISSVYFANYIDAKRKKKMSQRNAVCHVVVVRGSN